MSPRRAWFVAAAAAGVVITTPAVAAAGPSDVDAALRWGTFWRWTALGLALGGIVIGAFALERLGRADADEIGQKAYRVGAIALALAATLCVIAALAAIPGGLWREAEALTRHDWFRNNFELPLVAAGVAVVAIADRINRAIMRAQKARSSDMALPDEALAAPPQLASLIIGCAIGASILVAIGSSAFSASLWQREMQAYVSQDANVSLERVQFMVDRIGALDDQVAALDSEVERLKVRMRRHDARAAAHMALHERLWQEALTLQAGGASEAARIASLRQRARVATLDAVQERVSAGQAAAQADVLINEIDLIEFRQRCRVHNFAMVIAELSAAGEVAAPVPVGPRNDEAVCVGAVAVPHAAFARANAILETAQPLRRSWMSSQLARRTPILLSIELVLLMGALGALLRTTARALSPEKRAKAQARGALLPLGLNIAFGMSTALVFFVLLNSAMTAASIDGVAVGDVADGLNPFTVALVGLAGGYAAREVLKWLGRVVQGNGKTNAETSDLESESASSAGHESEGEQGGQRAGSGEGDQQTDAASAGVSPPRGGG